MRVNLPVTNEEYVLPASELIVSRTDLKGRITYVNDTFVDSSGFAREELIGKAHNIVRHPDMPSEAFADLWRTLQQGRPWSGMVKNRRKDGGFYWVYATVTPLLAGGSCIGYMSVRTAPTQAQKDAATELYRRMREGQADGAYLAAGELRHTGWRGVYERLCRTSFTARCWATALALAGIHAVALVTALLAGGALAVPVAATAVVGMAAAVTCGLWWSATVGRPIEHAVATALQVVGGEVSTRFPAHGESALKNLFQMLDQMNANLVGVLKDVNGRMQHVGEEAAEIASGNGDLSQRTEEQAASLEETASSMEELTSTVKQNADNAREANRLAAAASSIATQGGAAVRSVVDTMAEIERSSRRIAEINGTIDALAFQTNILALNAAVEAARAGEQGRGFAVVASEVRALAQRSAAAAKEIKALIEQSVGQVAAGTRLVDDAGRTMGEIVSSVQRVNDIMAEISSASAEQSSGIDQVGQAVMQLDQVTQQNAALVEEVAASAESLRVQTRYVADAMRAMHLGQSQPLAAPVARPKPAATPKRLGATGSHAAAPHSLRKTGTHA